MNWGRWKNYSAIGLDLGTRLFKAVQLRRHGSFWRIESTAVMERIHPEADLAGPQGLEDLKRFMRVLDLGGFTGRCVVVAAPVEHVRAHVLDLPASDAEDQLAQEMARLGQLQTGTFEMSWWELPRLSRPGAVRQVMAVALAHRQAELFLKTLEQVGWKVEVLDHQPCALARACAWGQEHAGAEDRPDSEGKFTSISAIVDMGWKKVWLVLEGGGRVLYQRQLEEPALVRACQEVARRLELEASAAEHLVRQVGLHMAGSLAEAMTNELEDVRQVLMELIWTLVEEISASVAYARHRFADWPVQRVLLTGGGAGLPGLVEQLAAACELPVDIAGPPDELSTAFSGLQESPAERRTMLMAALGLALASLPQGRRMSVEKTVSV